MMAKSQKLIWLEEYHLNMRLYVVDIVSNVFQLENCN